MSEIQSLASRVQDLERSWSNWNSAYLTFTGIVIVLALVAFLLQFVASRKSVLLIAAQSKYSQAKDQQAAVDSQNKDVEIGTTKASAAKANDHAAQLELRSEQLHKENIELEKALSGRIFNNQDDAARQLAKFGPVDVLIEYLPDWECRRTAGQVAFVLSEAKWNITGFVANPNDSVFFDGVGVAVNASGPVPEPIRRASDAGYALVAELNKTDITATTRAMGLSFRLGLVVVRIGLKPNPVAQRLRGISGNALFP